MHGNAPGPTVLTGFKGEFRASLPDEEVLLTFRKHFKFWSADPRLSEALYEDPAAVASDFENAVRQLITPRVVIEELRINRYLNALLWRLWLCERHLRIAEMWDFKIGR